MQKKIYNSKINYDGKWVLYRDYGTDRNFGSIFVITIKDGIIKYYNEYDTNTPHYGEVRYFENCHDFFINPIQMESPLIRIKRRDEYDKGDEERDYGINWDWDGGKGTSYYGHQLNECCDHDWVKCVSWIYPHIERRICRKCGAYEDNYHNSSDDMCCP